MLLSSSSGKTVQTQYQGPPLCISSWSHITNAHPVPGPGIVHGLRQDLPKDLLAERGLLLIAKMSTTGSMATDQYTKDTIDMAQKEDPERQWVFGFIAGHRVVSSPDYIWLTPGVNTPNVKKDHLGQQYQTPDSVILSKKSDIIIVGRGIYASDNPAEAAEEFKHWGWNAYLKRVQNSSD